MSWLPWYRRGKARSEKSKREAQQNLDKLHRQQPEVDDIVAELRDRLERNNFRRAVEEAFRGNHA